MVFCLWKVVCWFSCEVDWSQGQSLAITPLLPLFKFEAIEQLEEHSQTIDPDFRPTELFQDATLIFKNSWILLSRNHIPWTCLPNFLQRSLSVISFFELQILANSYYLSRSQWSCAFHNFCCNVTLGAVSEDTNWNFPAHQTPRVKWIASVHSVEREGKGAIYLYPFNLCGLLTLELPNGKVIRTIKFSLVMPLDYSHVV